MGPQGKFRGLGGTLTGASTGIVNAPPTHTGNGSGGAGVLGGNVSSASIGGEIDDLLAGRITLGVVSLSIIGLVAFYVWTRSAQGGG